jgi:vancomycin permeability regulator SanA
MVFQRRHYEKLAEFSADAKLTDGQIKLLEHMLSDDNSRFSYMWFEEAIDMKKKLKETGV